MNEDKNIDHTFPADVADELWREGLKRGQRVGLRVATASMSPFLKRGDRVLVERYPAGAAPRRGDIVLLSVDGRWIMHRVIGLVSRQGSSFCRQKGDAGHYSVLTPLSSVAGRLVAIDRDSGRIALDTPWQQFLQRLLGMIFAVLDWTARRGRPAEREKVAGPGEASPLRVQGFRILRAAESAVARVGAWLVRVARRR